MVNLSQLYSVYEPWETVVIKIEADMKTSNKNFLY